jgi:hypothetical protein
MLALRHELESSMALHMGIQIPLLVVLGGVAGSFLRRRFPQLRVFSQRYRTSLLLVALFTFGLWMLPRLLDAALHEPVYALLKWLSLPVAGIALVLSWRHLPFVLRGVLHIEALAMLLRLGWLYLIAPQRYCVSYVIDDQVILGYLLLSYGALYALLLVIGVMLGGGSLPSVADKHSA